MEASLISSAREEVNEVFCRGGRWRLAHVNGTVVADENGHGSE